MRACAQFVVCKSKTEFFAINFAHFHFRSFFLPENCENNNNKTSADIRILWKISREIRINTNITTLFFFTRNKR